MNGASPTSEMAGKMNIKAAAAMAAVGPVKRAYVTVLAGDDEELQAVVQLAEDLRKVGAAYPLVVAVLPDAPESRRRILVSHGCVVREVQPVVYQPEFLAMAAPPRNFINYSKLRVWEFVEYGRMVYLDAGMHVLENIDELFDLEKGHFHYAAAELGIMFVHELSSATAQALLDARPESFFLEEDFMIKFFRDQHKPIPLDLKLVLGHTAEDDAQLDEAKRRAWGGMVVPPMGSWFPTKAKVLYQQNLPAMVVSLAAMGVINNSAYPVICSCFYTVFIAAIAAVTISVRRI